MSKELPPASNSSTQESFLQRFGRLFKKTFKFRHSSFEESVTELLKEHDEDSSVHSEEKAILHNILTFGDLEASDVMLPRTEIVAVPVSIKIDELKRIFVDEGHSRIPVYTNSIDDIIGFIHIKDLFKKTISKSKVNLKDLVRDLIYVPATIKITDLLSRMKQSSSHIAIILDEYGGTDGLVTIEDIIEEIFGDIVDEHDQANDHDMIVYDGDGYMIDAKARIESVESAVNVKLKEKHSNYDTFGGYMMSELGRIPKAGEIIEVVPNIKIEIVDADHRKIKMMKLVQNA